MSYVETREFDLYKVAIRQQFDDLTSLINSQRKNDSQLLQQIYEEIKKTNEKIDKFEDFKERTVLEIQELKHANSLYQASCPASKIKEDLNEITENLKEHKIAQDKFENSLKVVKFFSDHPGVLYVLLLICLVTPVQNLFSILLQLIK